MGKNGSDREHDGASNTVATGASHAVPTANGTAMRKGNKDTTITGTIHWFTRPQLLPSQPKSHLHMIQRIYH